MPLDACGSGTLRPIDTRDFVYSDLWDGKDRHKAYISPEGTCLET
jgi:hypothetical protein